MAETEQPWQSIKGGPGWDANAAYRFQFVQKLKTALAGHQSFGAGDPGNRYAQLFHYMLAGDTQPFVSGGQNWGTPKPGDKDYPLVEIHKLLKPDMTDEDMATVKSKLDEYVAAHGGDSSSAGWAGDVKSALDNPNFRGFLKDPGAADATITGGETTPQDTGYAAKLKEFHDALYNKGTASRIGAMAAEGSARESAATGWKGPVVQQGVNQSVADAAFKYDQAVNGQALQAIGAENANNLGMSQLQLQADQYNNNIMNQYAQQQAQMRAQTGGTIGGVVGGVVGTVAQAYGVPGGAQIGTSIGTGVGTAAGGGGAYQPSTLRGGSTGGKKYNQGGNSGGWGT